MSNNLLVSFTGLAFANPKIVTFSVLQISLIIMLQRMTTTNGRMTTRFMSLAHHYNQGIYAILRIARKLSLEIDLYYLTEENSESVPARYENMPDGFSAEIVERSLDETTLSDITAMNQWSNLESIQSRLASGHWFFALRHRERLVGYTWIRFDQVDEPNCDYELSVNEAFLQGAFIDPKYRNGGLATIMRVQVYRMLEKRGIGNVVSTTDVLNLPAKKFKAKLAAKHSYCYASVSFSGFTVFKKKFDMCRNDTRDHGRISLS